MSNDEFGKFLIYGLLDMRPEHYRELRYIGRSSSGLRRPKKHLTKTAAEQNTHLAHWLRVLAQLSMKPEIVVLRRCSSESELNNAEMECISIARMGGISLVNLTDGGDGVTGYVPSALTRNKMSMAQKERFKSEEQRAWQAQAHLGSKMSVEARQKIGAAHRGKVTSEETKKKMSLAAKGRKLSPETRQKLSEAHKGKTHSAETKARMSATRRAMARESENRRRSKLPESAVTDLRFDA